MAQELQVRNLNLRTSGVERLVGLDLEFKSDRLNVLLGPTGAGKTSLMRVLAGLESPDPGSVVIEGGQEVTAVPTSRRDVGFVYQQFINYPSLSVYENIASPLRQAARKFAGAGTPEYAEADIDTRVRDLAARLGLSKLLERLPHELSGGQQQRTALGRALARRPRLLLLDEPLVNLDYKLREGLRNELLDLLETDVASSGPSPIVIYATSDPLDALLLGGHTAVLNHGQALQSGPAVDVFHRPANLAVARIFSDPPLNVCAGRMDTDGSLVLDAVPGVLDLSERAVAYSGAVQVGVRPAALALVEGSSQPADPANLKLDCTVALAEISGTDTLMHVQLAEQQLQLTAQVSGIHRLDPGSSVLLQLPADQVFLFDERGALISAPPDARGDANTPAGENP